MEKYRIKNTGKIGIQKRPHGKYRSMDNTKQWEKKEKTLTKKWRDLWKKGTYKHIWNNLKITWLVTYWVLQLAILFYNAVLISKHCIKCFMHILKFKTLILWTRATKNCVLYIFLIVLQCLTLVQLEQHCFLLIAASIFLFCFLKSVINIKTFLFSDSEIAM